MSSDHHYNFHLQYTRFVVGQIKDSLVVKRRNDNHSPVPVIAGN